MLKYYDVVIIGGGQSGLGMGYRLKSTNLSWIILDAAPFSGYSWEQRWDSLKLFSPKHFSRLPGLPHSSDTAYYPSKDQFANYLKAYAKMYNLPVKYNCRVAKLTQTDLGFKAETQNGDFYARKVIIATGAYNLPHVPNCAGDLSDKIWQLHSSKYQSKSMVPKGSVLVVGGGNSAAQIAVELANTHAVTLASRGPIHHTPQKIFGLSIFWVIYLLGLFRVSKDSIIGRYLRPYSNVVVGSELNKQISGGQITHIPSAVVSVKADNIIFADGTTREFKSIIWCTGYDSGHNWIKVKGATTEKNLPIQNHGISPISGLFWLGIPWQSRLDSALICGVKSATKRLLREINSVP